MEMNRLWEGACAILQNDMNRVVYNTWINNNLTPELQDGDTLVLSIAMENMRTQLVNKHQEKLERALTQAAGHTMTVEILTRAELKDRQAARVKPVPTKVSEAAPETMLNPRYTFDTFVVGSQNRFAHAAALAVAETPAEAFNPLFLYGGVGLGKTHLMHAVGHFIRETDPTKKIVYIPGEQFTTELIQAIQQNQQEAFRNRYRNVDVLMVDDIQFIAGKDATQEEFFHTFNALHSAGRQVILSSDRPPQEMERLEERLRSRFASGLLADIQKPDFETRVAILRAKAERDGMEVPAEILGWIANHIDTNIRELEGSLNRLMAYANLIQKPLTIALCEEALRDLMTKAGKREITPEYIMQTVASYYAVSLEELVGHNRRREVVVPRQIAMYLTREMTQLSLPQIGHIFGGRDHTTVLHGCDKISASIREDSAGLAQVIQDIKTQIRDGGAH